MTKKAVFSGMLRAAASETHPGQQLLSFVFTDYQPNKNKQGVPRSEAENIIRTGTHMPVKMSFAGRKPKGHLGAIPIGPILSLHEEEDRIIGEAVVWKKDYPDVAAYLEKASAESGGAQFSWELFYQDSEIDQEGVQWLKGIVTAGITIVDTPAYQGRTPLLAVAEEQYYMEELQKRVEELAGQIATLTAAVAEKDKELESLRTSASATEGELASAKSEADALRTEAEELRTFKAAAEKAEAETKLLDTRKSVMAEAGLDESVFAKRKEQILTMSDDTFKTYVDDLAAVAKGKAQASVNEKIIIPDPVTSHSASAFSVKDVAKALRGARG